MGGGELGGGSQQIRSASKRGTKKPRPSLGFLVLGGTRHLYPIGEWLTGFGCSEDGYRSKSRLLLHLRQNLGEIEMKWGLFFGDVLGANSSATHDGPALACHRSPIG